MPLKKLRYFLVFLFPAFVFAQRLPAGVTPQHYDLTFTPDLQKATFSGEETIEVALAKPAASITLNAAELQFQKAEITQAGKTQEAQSSLASEKEQATLTVPEPLQAGPATVHISFTGILNNQLRGFYLAKSRTRNYATTQFEATDARRAFPSFDEPALKAKFDITLIVDRGDTAISNGSIVSDTPGPGENKHTLKFSTTPKMSTYLVAMAVGDFECNEGAADNIPVRVCGTPDKKPLGTAALRYAEEILKFYNQYYGITYPFGKLDILGVPDFEAGAMENTAAIFYRESDLFIDDQNSSAKSHQNVFEVLAHEMAHQWFGDLVTMKWWDNVWLNESFATWMALKPSQALHPEWNAALDAVHETDTALRADALQHTHPIRATAETPDQINEMFDAISYEKGAAVLRMIESYVTPDVFRRGVNAYLRKFAYSNATAEDFWRSVAAASGRPVDAIMPTFVEQPGEPLITVKSSCAAPAPEPARRRGRHSRRRRALPKAQPKTEITLTQARFWADPSAAHGSSSTWMVPVCVKTDDAKPFCQIVSQKEQVVPVSGCGAWTFVNANASGYYRTQYDSISLAKLTSVAPTALTTAERISLLNDEGALAHSGQESVSSYLNLVSALGQDPERAVIESYLPELNSIDDYLLTDADRTAFRDWVRSNSSPMLTKIGWTAAPGESEDLKTARGHLVRIMGQIGGDPVVIQHSVELAQQYIKDRHAIDPSMVREVLLVAAESNNPELFSQYLKAISDPAATPEEISNFAIALANFTDFTLTQQWLQKIVAPETRSQDAPFYIGAVLQNVAVQKPAWEWVKQHWSDVQGKLPAGIFSGGFARAAAGFCDTEMRDDVQHFFTEQKLAGTGRALGQAVERINACIDYRSRQQNNLAAWLQQHPASAAAGNR
ncbi:MAG TPA: M1 family metallopeptidase [Terriglobales bacterium]|nr:M1 family metallopeptidase [Terriglobales bacterium]